MLVKTILLLVERTGTDNLRRERKELDISGCNIGRIIRFRRGVWGGSQVESYHFKLFLVMGTIQHIYVFEVLSLPFTVTQSIISFMRLTKEKHFLSCKLFIG